MLLRISILCFTFVFSSNAFSQNACQEYLDQSTFENPVLPWNEWVDDEFDVGFTQVVSYTIETSSPLEHFMYR